MLLLVAAIVCGDPRGYQGPPEAPSGESQVEPQEQPAVETPRGASSAPLERDPTIPSEGAREPERRPFSARQLRMPGTGTLEPPVVPLRTGRGLLIAGGVFAGAGAVLSIVSVAAWFRPCSGFCEPYGAIYTSLAAPVPWLVGIGMLGVGMQRRSHIIASRRLADRLAPRPPRRGVFAAGLTMTIVGVGAIVGSWWAPGISAFVQLGGGPLAVAGAMMAGSARGRRLAVRDYITVAPVLTRTTAMLSLRTRW